MSVIIADTVEQEIKISLDDLIHMGSIDNLNEYIDEIVGEVLEDLSYRALRVEDDKIVLHVIGLKVDEDEVRPVIATFELLSPGDILK
jgi:hypothetical protein